MIADRAPAARPPARLHADPPELAADGQRAARDAIARSRRTSPATANRRSRPPSFDATHRLHPGARADAPVHARRLQHGRPDRAPRRVPRSTIDRLILVGASPGIQDAEGARSSAKQADDALADRIEAIGVEAFAKRMGRAAAVRRPARARQDRRLRRPAAQHAARPRQRAARPRHRRHGAALGPAARADDPRHADHRRARREVPRARRSDAAAATERDPRDDPGRRARRRSSRTRDAVAQAIYQSGSPSSSASA